ncbi:LysR family transcriptional regulator [Thalassospiraceae bacterium LMO-JJ14]|nr:LysR family transcriptional regulator [Thalassospiraceae bacterium LMO-JJ14]
MSFAWDDLRVFLEIARSGSLSGAAKALGVNHSTVFRRINAFEDGLGVRLFERLQSGYVLTLAGEEMRASALRVEHEIERVDLRISGQDLKLEGSLVVTTTDTLAENLLGPHLAAFNKAYPGIRLELVLDNQHVNLSKRQADVAVRPTITPPETLVGRRLCGLAFAPYAAKSYAKKHAGVLADMDWLRVDESLAHLSSDKWFRRQFPDAHIALRSNSLLGLLHACEAGMGAALLACFMTDRRPKLTRLAPPIDAAGSALWLLTHEDLRHTGRVRAFMDFMATSLAAEIDFLEGRG